MDPVSVALPQNLQRIFVATLEQGGGVGPDGHQHHLQHPLEGKIGKNQKGGIKQPLPEPGTSHCKYQHACS